MRSITRQAAGITHWPTCLSLFSKASALLLNLVLGCNRQAQEIHYLAVSTLGIISSGYVSISFSRQARISYPAAVREGRLSSGCETCPAMNHLPSRYDTRLKSRSSDQCPKERLGCNSWLLD